MSLSELLKNFFRGRAGGSANVVAENAASQATSGNLESLKVVELKAMAKEQGLTGYSKLNKAQLIELLK